jgi:hypothetical protein
VRNTRVTVEEREKAEEAAIADACERLRPLTEPARAWAIISWGDPDADPRDKYEAAVEYVIALLDPAKPTSSAQTETYDSRAQHAADTLLGAHASIVRKFVLPALRLGRVPERKGPRSRLLRNRYIAAVVTAISQQYGLGRYHSGGTNKHACDACTIVAEAAKRLGIKNLTRKTVMEIYKRHRQD